MSKVVPEDDVDLSFLPGAEPKKLRMFTLMFHPSVYVTHIDEWLFLIAYMQGKCVIMKYLHRQRYVIIAGRLCNVYMNG